ncbi:hypothetical protein GCM10018785_47890 [Streptomyces longispororuber]|uniref:Uncharacterized protein n=1 Tax=Streptomyces longispororuber TaxID=68230 RepID=A0A918ZWF2_9ACTN|nr:hypothetical protein GCM10018785_47890 [Streptomyces longispororuber]
MHDDEGAVLAEVQVEFDDVQARGLRGDERPQGVLGFDAHDTAMPDGEEVQDRLASVDGGSAPRGAPAEAHAAGRSLIVRLHEGTVPARRRGVVRSGAHDAQEQPGDDGGDENGASAQRFCAPCGGDG